MKFPKRSDATWLLPPLKLLLLKVLLPSLMFGMLPSPWPMLEEFSALKNQGMSCGPGFLHPLNRNVVCCRRDYKIKHPPEGSIARISPSSLLLDIISNKALWKLSVINIATVCIVLSLDVINGFLKEKRRCTSLNLVVLLVQHFLIMFAGYTNRTMGLNKLHKLGLIVLPLI